MQLLFFNYKKRFLIVLLYSFITFTSIGLIYDIYFIKPHDIIIDIILISLSSFLIFLVKKHNQLILATLILFWFSTVAIFYYNILYKFDNNTLYFIILPIIAIVLLPYRLVKINLALYFITLFALFIYGYKTMPEIPFFKDNLANLIIVVGYVVLFVFFYHNTIEASYSMLLKLNRQKELLLLELHHRVKNNLNLLISLLGLEESKSKELKDFINRFKFRINSLALVHEMLFFEEQFENINLQEYIGKLVTHILASSHKNIETNIDIEPICVDISTAINLGLMLNEWVLNSIKYAFNSDKKAIIYLKIVVKENIIYLEYKDNGEEKNLNNRNGLGMQIVDIAAAQIGAKLIKEPYYVHKVIIEGANIEYCNSRR